METIDLDQHDRFIEIASILAGALLRIPDEEEKHRQSVADPPASSLEVDPKTVLSGTCG